LMAISRLDTNLICPVISFLDTWKESTCALSLESAAHNAVT
jgi:hypothetical protein